MARNVLSRVSWVSWPETVQVGIAQHVQQFRRGAADRIGNRHSFETERPRGREIVGQLIP